MSEQDPATQLSSTSMRWFLCFQTPYDTVRLITSESDVTMSLKYYKFFEFVAQIVPGLQDYVGFRDKIDRFETILVSVEDKMWELYHYEVTPASIKELYKLNPSKQKLEEEEKKKSRSLADRIHENKIKKRLFVGWNR